jgi:hypothetical protein
MNMCACLPGAARSWLLGLGRSQQPEWGRVLTYKARSAIEESTKNSALGTMSERRFAIHRGCGILYSTIQSPARVAT